MFKATKGGVIAGIGSTAIVAKEQNNGIFQLIGLFEVVHYFPHVIIE
jgi:hypothetical protein